MEAGGDGRNKREAPQDMSNEVNYVDAALRHLKDGRFLNEQGSRANAGQLFGFSVECGIKAVLIACGVAKGPDGGIAEKNPLNQKKAHPLRTHMPTLPTRINTFGYLIPDGPKATGYFAMLAQPSDMDDWSVDHRYWSESSLPLASLPAWERLAVEANAMLDQAKLDGVL